jgi:hypothetical protein
MWDKLLVRARIILEITLTIRPQFLTNNIKGQVFKKGCYKARWALFLFAMDNPS